MRLRIALQKSGRMGNESLALIKRCGLSVSNTERNLFIRVPELPIDILLVRNDDILGFLQENICDVAILGEDIYREADSAGECLDVEILQRLEFSRCKLCMAVPESSAFEDISDLEGARIATSYPRSTAQYLEKLGVHCELVPMEGSVEVAPQLGIAQGISDLVSTGATLAANGMRILTELFSSEAILIGKPSSMEPERALILSKLQTRIRGVIKAKKSKYIMLHSPAEALDEIQRNFPGAKSPTILPLAHDPETFAVHAVCEEDIFWETMEKLKQLGASAILVLPIEKMMP